jgi:antitoxin component YwqK of YwqJK toxin-antitoxin module
VQTKIFYRLLLLLFPIIISSCANEVVLTDETLPEEIFYKEGTNKPYTGRCVVYYRNTKNIHYTFTFEKGILNGAFASYFRNGKIEYSGNYNNGELVGNFTKYDENGTVNLTCQLNDQSQRSR